MSSACRVCTRPELQRINEALSQGVSLRALEEQFHVSRSALSRHQQGHREGCETPPSDAAPVTLEPPRSVTRVRTCVVCMLPDEPFCAIESALAQQ